MEKQKVKKLASTGLKVVVTGLALYLVSRKIDPEETWFILRKTDPFYLLLAAFLFVASKAVAAVRLNSFFSSIPLKLPEMFNLRLYWVGMFYNLFLPGGIGGDGYKVYLLNRYYRKKVKTLIGATLIDRISGLMALLWLLLGLVIIVLPSTLPPELIWLCGAGVLLGYPLFYIFNRLLFKTFLPVFLRTSLLSLGVQILQLCCAYNLLCALDVTAESILSYLLLFLVSSVVAVLPFTIGGVGARELTFVYGNRYLPIDENTAVAFSLLFFTITAVVSLAGVFMQTEKPGNNPTPRNTAPQSAG